MYEDQTYETILDRMLARVDDTLDKRQGSVIYDSLAPVATEIESFYAVLNDMQAETDPASASREYLELMAEQRSITPKAASYAVLTAAFTGATPATGARFTGGDCTYTLTSTNQVTCEQEGVVGNAYIGAIIPIDYISGLTSAEITSVAIPGEDVEGTEDLRTDYTASFDSKSFSGNVSDYTTKAEAISGVGDAKVTPIWNGGGTVKVTILDSNHSIATSTLIASVQSKFDPNADGKGSGLAPIGHVVTVDTATEVTVAITSTITYDTGYSAASVQTLVEAAIESYLLELRTTWKDNDTQTVRIAQIDSKILGVVGILDVTGTTINSGTTNLTLTKYQVPKLGVVTLA